MMKILDNSLVKRNFIQSEVCSVEIDIDEL